ncbi:hypothetical protein EYF80_033183 [Liparis tanakae]|uniref:Uncharacterized protein n=1 Tax=Liparis tanakae TaxID=230148 RepID=A0A4Z2GT21_9TELE|nr:hypothetical protein EYF80_033183 [Liparis tanakae]
MIPTKKVMKTMGSTTHIRMLESSSSSGSAITQEAVPADQGDQVPSDQVPTDQGDQVPADQGDQVPSDQSGIEEEPEGNRRGTKEEPEGNQRGTRGEPKRNQRGTKGDPIGLPEELHLLHGVPTPGTLKDFNKRC